MAEHRERSVDIYEREQQAKKVIDESRKKITGEELKNIHFSNIEPEHKQDEKKRPAA
ncbi:MAG TPA: hypothetical protein VHV83_01530 [Armatimonadota bacterium]|nr:hypothetical protein [Armatimonadota bacterium]